jgi:hypothetical protein
MDETDAFFTQTIVGAPFTVLLGRRRTSTGPGHEGLDLNMLTGENHLSRIWRDWVVLSHACDPVGHTRQRPGRLRRWLERHALWVALLGLTSLLLSLLVWGLNTWS